jgi:hypothetical protein
MNGLLVRVSPLLRGVLDLARSLGGLGTVRNDDSAGEPLIQAIAFPVKSGNHIELLVDNSLKFA